MRVMATARRSGVACAALALSVAASLLAVAPARAADARTEAAASIAIHKAAEAYLATDYGAATAVLQKALRACGAARCSAPTRAAVLRDLAVMQFRNGDAAAAAKSFAAAQALQPGIALNPDYDAPDLRAALAVAKGPVASPSAEPPPEGDFTHTPVSEQKANTPLPIYVAIDGMAVVRVVVKYQGAGMKDPARLEMKRMNGGWGALVPCGAVKTGDLRYWIVGFDASGSPTASSGNPKRPFDVPIREAIAAEAPHLPGEAPPPTCTEDAAAPEDAGEASSDEATGGPTEEESGAGRSSGSRGSRHSDEPVYARWWIGVAGAIDFVSLPAGSDVCALNASREPNNAAGYYCTNPDGSDFPSRSGSAQNASLIPGQAGQVPGSLHVGDLRALAVVDYALGPDLLIGGRVGYVLNAYPGSGAAVTDGRAFGAKVHLEGRVTYLFGDAPLAHVGFAPTVFGAFGVASFDGHSITVVSMKPSAGTVPVTQPVTAWRTSGPWFVAAGVGARYQFSQRVAFTIAARVNAAFGGGGALFTFGPEIAFQYGF
jgi:hypothetical protein